MKLFLYIRLLLLKAPIAFYRYEKVEASFIKFIDRRSISAYPRADVIERLNTYKQVHDLSGGRDYMMKILF